MRWLDDIDDGVLLLVTVAVLSVMLSQCQADAQAIDNAIVTARVCLSESDRPDECTQIVHATAERAVMHGRSYRAELYSYSPRATGRRSYGARSWISRMHPDRPVAAPLALNREALRWRFSALVVAAWRALSEGERAPCPGAIEWGARWCAACRRRMHVARYVVARCNLANRWWAPL